MRRIVVKFDMKLREVLVSISAIFTPPDRDAGIMNWSLDDFDLRDMNSNLIDWELTEEETAQLEEVAYAAFDRAHE